MLVPFADNIHIHYLLIHCLAFVLQKCTFAGSGSFFSLEGNCIAYLLFKRNTYEKILPGYLFAACCRWL